MEMAFSRVQFFSRMRPQFSFHAFSGKSRKTKKEKVTRWKESEESPKAELQDCMQHYSRSPKLFNEAGSS